MRKIRKGDEVIVLAGKDKGSRGTVTRVQPNGKMFVEGVNLVKRHTRPNPQANQPGGIVQQEAALEGSNLALFNPATGKGDRVGFKTLDDGRKVRVFRSSGEVVDS
ncbi:MAG: 50S ribosomal protein L24 [Gammaproteobacteria bacterium]|nr:50S ribosomal protein L24 [Gammaproteobacteria bacterium]